MGIHDDLKAKRRGLGSSLDTVQGGVMMVSLMVGPVAFTFISFALFGLLSPWLGDPGGWFEAGAHPVARILAVLFVIGVMLIGVGSALYVTYESLEQWWKRYYKLAWEYIEEKDFALLVMDDLALSPIYEVTERYAYLKWTRAGRPQSMDERIEFASDYWCALVALADNRHGKLHSAVRRGNFTRRVDDLFGYIFNGCTAITFLAISGPFIILTLPLYVYGVSLVLQQQAFQAALLDYFSETGFNDEISEE